MTLKANMSLKEALEKARAEMMKQAGGALDKLLATATELEMKEPAERVKEARENLASETFKIIIVGRFKNGKSTLMNTLLGRLTHPVPELEKGQGPMPVDDLPCTATLTSIQYSERPYVRMRRKDRKWEDWSLERYLRESTVKGDEEENQQFFANIRNFELGFPAELCKSGVTLMDSPGLDDVPERTLLTREAVATADAAIVVYRSDVFAGEGERLFVADEVSGSGTRVFTVVNLMYNRPADERFKGFVWNRLVHDAQNGPKYAGQDFASRDIYFIDALKAQRGKLSDDGQLIEESGLALLEKRLADFLINERHITHLEKHLKRADIAATSIEQQVEQRRAAIRQDEQKLQQAFETIQPQIEAIHARREALPKIFARFRGQAQRDLRASFAQLINQIRQDFPEELKRAELPTAKNWGVMKGLRQKQLCKEAAEICQHSITDKIMTWSNNPPDKPGARQTLEPILQNMFEEIRDEVARMDRAFGAVHFKLTGWSPQMSAPTSIVSMQERVLSGGAGLLLGDLTAIIGGGGGGWRSVAGVFAGKFAAAYILMALGLVGSTVLLPATILAAAIGSIIGAGVKVEERVKTKVLELVMQKLRTVPEEAGEHIDAEMKNIFDQTEAEVMNAATAIIEEEEQNIVKMVELNKRSRTEKAQILEALDKAMQQVAEQREILKGMTVKAMQTA